MYMDNKCIDEYRKLKTCFLVNNIEGDSRNLTSYATDHGLYMPGGKEMRKQMLEYFPHSFEGKSRL